MITLIKKLIPVEIKIKSLYWKQKEDEMDSDLKKIFRQLDIDEYDDVQKIFRQLDIDEYDDVQNMIDEFHQKWDVIKKPIWLSLKSAEISRAQTMYYFLKSEHENS